MNEEDHPYVLTFVYNVSIRSVQKSKRTKTHDCIKGQNIEREDRVSFNVRVRLAVNVQFNTDHDETRMQIAYKLSYEINRESTLDCYYSAGDNAHTYTHILDGFR